MTLMKAISINATQRVTRINTQRVTNLKNYLLYHKTIGCYARRRIQFVIAFFHVKRYAFAAV